MREYTSNAVASPYGHFIDFAAKEREARALYAAHMPGRDRARRVASAPGRAAGGPARRKDSAPSAWQRSAAVRLRLAESV